MQVVKKSIWRDRIVPIGWVAAAMLGTLLFVIFGRADAAFAGASFALICGYLGNAHFTNERDGAYGIRVTFSVAQILEFFLASSLVLSGFPIAWSWSLLAEFSPAAHILLPFYAVKLMLTFVLRSMYGISNPERAHFSCLAYSVLTVVSVIALEVSVRSGAFLGVRLLHLLIVWFTVPTVTFYLDMRKENPLSVRYAVWRSVFEVLFVYPIFSFFAIFLTTLATILTESFGMFISRLHRPGPF